MPTLKNVMSTDIETVLPAARISDVAEKMKSLDVGFIPVCDGRKIRGMITDRDIAVRVVAGDLDPHETRAEDIMTKNVFYLYDDEDVAEAAQMMQKEQIRRIIVVDRGKRLVGVVSIGDLARGSESPQLTGHTLREVSRGDKMRSIFRKQRHGEEISLSPGRSSNAGWLSVLAGAAVVGAIAWLGTKYDFSEAVDFVKRRTSESIGASPQL